MDRHSPDRLAVAAALCALCLLSGCARSGQTRYYTLVALAPAASAAPTAERVLGVGPVRVSRHLREGAMVRRTDAYQLRHCDFDLWAEPVEDGVPRVLAANLGQLTGTRRVARYPWRSAETPERQVAIDLEAFELAADGQAELRARWELRDAAGTLLDSGTTTVREPADGRVDALAAALSRALLGLSRDLAAALSR
jgi:uncharacterized lipoprotein YmbA